MYTVLKALNNNAVIALKDNKQLLLLGNGIGFSTKTGSRLDVKPNTNIYSLQETNGAELIQNVEPVYLEIADLIICEAKRIFGDGVDNNVLLPLADHISFAIERIRNQLNISNPFAEDIKLLFPQEFQIAQQSIAIIKEKVGVYNTY